MIIKDFSDAFTALGIVVLFGILIWGFVATAVHNKESLAFCEDKGFVHAQPDYDLWFSHTGFVCSDKKEFYIDGSYSIRDTEEFFYSKLGYSE